MAIFRLSNASWLKKKNHFTRSVLWWLLGPLVLRGLDLWRGWLLKSSDPTRVLASSARCLSGDVVSHAYSFVRLRLLISMRVRSSLIYFLWMTHTPAYYSDTTFNFFFFFFSISFTSLFKAVHKGNGVHERWNAVCMDDECVLSCCVLWLGLGWESWDSVCWGWWDAGDLAWPTRQDWYILCLAASASRSLFLTRKYSQKIRFICIDYR